MNIIPKTSFIAILIAIAAGVTSPAFAAQDRDGDGVPDTSEPLIHSDPLNPDTDGDGINDLKDDKPTFATNPLAAGGPSAPFVVKEALVENNFDVVLKKDAPDHLEVQVLNPTATDLAGFSIYYTIQDKESGTTEAYFATLPGFTVPAHGGARIHFDDTGLPGHFRANPNSIYKTTQAAKVFTVSIKTNGYSPITVTIKKDAGGAETAD
ncbi:MAG: hypothetical protein JKY17_01875 [Magnetovibrio sp.]|nr:hypothetical protein [Magnetovibrio sp.]